MSQLIRISTLLAAFAAAGCVANADVGETSSAAAEPASSLYSEMHAAIPASPAQNKFFDYN